MNNRSLNNINKIWWLNPVWIYFGWTLFTCYCCFIDSNRFYEMYEEYIHITLYNVFLYFFFFFAFLIGYLSFKNNTIVYNTIFNYNPDKISKVFNILYWITISAYLIWALNLIIQLGTGIFYSIIMNFIEPSYGILDGNNKGSISGITTFTELGIVVGPLNVYLICSEHKKKYKRMFILLIILSILRAAIFSERLAFLEIALPSFVIYAYFGIFFRSKYVKFTPLIAIVALFAVFGAFEYFRSWSFYKEAYDNNFISFVIDRVFGYYSISVNTECIQVNYLEPRYFPLDSIKWFWTLPGMSSIQDWFYEAPSIDYLAKWGNPEFNNPGGLLFAFKDFGYFGLLFQLILGRFVAVVYKGYCKHGFISSLWYSVTFLCIVELPRYFFWGSQRAFFAIVAIFIVQRCLRKESFMNQTRKMQLNNIHY